MAQTAFTSTEPKKVSLDAAKKTAAELDDKSSAFHIPAETGAKLTLTGEFFESIWESKNEKGKVTGKGTILLAGIKELPKPLRLSFFRSKSLREETGNKEFKACFDKETSFETIINSLKKDKQVIVSRNDYVFPGRASARSVDTLVWAE